MKKMLLSGCSHSAGSGVKDINKSWGNIFAKNNNCELTNVAYPGGSLQYAIQQIINKISEEEFDVIILQLPDLVRYPLPYNGEEAFFTNDITNFKKNVPDVFHLNNVHYIKTDMSDKEYAYLQLVSGNTYLKSIGGSFPIKNEIIKFFYEQVTFSPFYLNTIINDIYLLQQLLKYKNIDFILIPYDDSSWGDNKTSIWRFKNSKKIDKTRYIDYPFMKWLRDSYNNPNNYYADNGFHLNEEGHIIFAEKYLPSFIKINFK
jgi:hypothetical protein